MTIEEIRSWAATEPPAVQQYVGELVEMVEMVEEADREALSLAKSLYRQYYQDIAPKWEPLVNAAGIITQIDNMVVGMPEIIRRQAFLEAAEMAENEYTGPGHNLASTRAICFVISEALRQRAEEGK